MVHCSTCSSVVPTHVDRCPGCFKDQGAPNVRASIAAGEREKVRAAVEARIAEATEAGWGEVLQAEHASLSRTLMVMGRSVADVERLVDADSQGVAPFHAQVAAGLRYPSDWFNKARPVADAVLFPSYMAHVHFGVLSLDGSPAPGYGECTMVLNEDHIAERATVFVENSLKWVDENNPRLRAPFPEGTRTTWSHRADLALMKLYSRLEEEAPKELDEAALQRLLIAESVDRYGWDFIEVHVYGPLNIHSVQSVRFEPEARSKRTDAQLNELERKLDALSIPVLWVQP